MGDDDDMRRRRHAAGNAAAAAMQLQQQRLQQCWLRLAAAAYGCRVRYDGYVWVMVR